MNTNKEFKLVYNQRFDVRVVNETWSCMPKQMLKQDKISQSFTNQPDRRQTLVIINRLLHIRKIFTKDICSDNKLEPFIPIFQIDKLK